MEQPQRSRWHKHPVTLSTIASVLMICGGIAPFAAYLSRNLLITYLAEAMATPIQAQVAKESAPTKGGVQALLQDKIDELATRIEVLETRARREPAKFTDADATELASVRSRLAKQREALAQTAVERK
jgi:hypothetical protein